MPNKNIAQRFQQALKSIFMGLVMGLLIPSFVMAQNFSLLPNGSQQYTNSLGQPVANGQVFYYVPNTATFKTIWQDPNGQTPQQNPVQLDAGGHPQPAGQTFGSGSYRQLVVDSNGLTVWDVITASTGASGSSSTALAFGDGLPVGYVTIWASPNPLPANYVYASGQAISRTTFSSLLATMTSVQTNVGCTLNNTTLTGVTDTTQIPTGAPIEGSCIPVGTTVVSTTSNTIVMSNQANATTTVSVTVFPFGNGDGATTFNVPNYNALALVGRNNMGGTARSDSFALTTAFYGVSPNALNAIGGAQSRAIAQANLPNVNFNISGITLNDPGHTHTSNLNINNAALGVNSGGAFAASTAVTGTISSATTGITVSNQGTAASGGSGTAISLVQPSATVNFIIKAIPDSQARIAFTILSASRLATTAALPANVYNNGASGVGATLTANANGALSVDGITVNTSDQILVNNEATLANNGIYTVTQAGSGGTPYILTRATFFNTAVNMVVGSYTTVTAGTANAGTAWVLQNSVGTVGTSSVVFNLFTGGVNTAGSILAGGSIKSQSPSGGVGYATAVGAGGAVTQITSRTTGVTLNNITGAITLFSAAGSATPATFTVTDSSVAASDVILINQKSGTNLYETFVTAVAAGSFNVTFFTTGGTSTDAPVFNFAVIKGSAN